MKYFSIAILVLITICSSASASEFISYQNKEEFSAAWNPPLKPSELDLLEPVREKKSKIFSYLKFKKRGDFRGLNCPEETELRVKAETFQVSTSKAMYGQYCTVEGFPSSYNFVGIVDFPKRLGEIKEQFGKLVNLAKSIGKKEFTFVLGYEAAAELRMKYVGLKVDKYLMARAIPNEESRAARIVPLKLINFLGMKIEPGSEICVEDIEDEGLKYEVHSIDSPEGKSVNYQGANCSYLSLTSKNLHQCRLSQNLKYKGLILPKGSTVTFKWHHSPKSPAIPIGVFMQSSRIDSKGNRYEVNENLMITEEGTFKPAAHGFIENINGKD